MPITPTDWDRLDRPQVPMQFLASKMDEIIANVQRQTGQTETVMLCANTTLFEFIAVCDP